MRFLTTYFSISILTSLFLISCEEEFLLENKNFKPTIILNSVFTNDSSWSVSLTTSRNLLDKNSKSLPITDASVLITKPSGVTLCILQHDKNGIYKSQNCFGTIEEEYHITVVSRTYGRVESHSSLPASASVQNIKVDSVDGENTKIDFTIEDNSKNKNFFIWSLVNLPDKHNQPIANNSIDITDWVKEIKSQLNTVKPTGKETELSLSSEESELSSTINKSLIAKNSIFKLDTIQEDDSIQPLKYKTYLRVMTVSDDLFKYYQSIEKYLQYKDNNTSVYDSEYIYSNIKGGSGIFAGYAVQYIPIGN